MDGDDFVLVAGKEDSKFDKNDQGKSRCVTPIRVLDTADTLSLTFGAGSSVCEAKEMPSKVGVSRQAAAITSRDDVMMPASTRSPSPALPVQDKNKNSTTSSSVCWHGKPATEDEKKSRCPTKHTTTKDEYTTAEGDVSRIDKLMDGLFGLNECQVDWKKVLQQLTELQEGKPWLSERACTEIDYCEALLILEQGDWRDW